ncbi:uncharacterized protein F5891DRAFT_1051822 [Suillus fuscotomentosus]|uniref:Uncharacterized protein n=1 Tax=Suillus fuscotomentosus TaxID=1912939 RepID=A0AAD4HHR4_9AGAM|nr:uncharacterized protein F5891DRAFT_1051822 [Suillus fuscotomentosus]KAG1896937.1 hypothetical protein F5891DRAFT_1051822 [Suillus fuscotomentosus]
MLWIYPATFGSAYTLILKSMPSLTDIRARPPRAMHFSFLRVVAVVTALTRSMSVTASQCASLGQACGTTNPTGLICCDDLFFVRFASKIQPHDSPLRLVPIGVRKFFHILRGT